MKRVDLAVLAAVAVAPGPASAQVEDTTQMLEPGPAVERINPFEGFETHYLSNGLKLWFKRRAGVPNVSVSVVVPYGSDRDPEGKEQLAHFTEHMLFSDHDGMTEEEIKDAVEGRGGQRNGITYFDRTFYYVTIAREHGLFALEWLSRLVEPHAMEPAVVDRGRQPVAVEINARPMQFFERVFMILNPEWLLPEGFWEREFGMETRPVLYDPWASLQRITPEDLRGFYERYYTPGAMTLTVVGDLERDSVLSLAERTFGTLPRRTVAPLGYDLEDPGRGRSVYAWGFGSDVGYQRRFKLFNHAAEDELHLLFIRDFLGRRLNQRLRYGERKAVYGLSVGLVKRGPAAYLQLSGDVNEDEYDYAVEVIEEELATLASAGHAPVDFEEDRNAVIERLRTANLTAQSLNFWTRTNFYNPNVFTDFPDLLGFYGQVTQPELASFVERTLIPERQLLSITYIQPVSQGVMLLLIVLLVVLTHKAVSGALTRPIEMRKIRYLARLQTPLLIKLGRALVFGGLGLVLARLWIWALIQAGSSWVVTVDSYLFQTGAYAAMLVASIALGVLFLSRFPRKLLVFPDHVLIKSRSYGSRAVRPQDVQELSRKGFKDVWLSGDILRTTALTFGMLKPGIYLEPKRGRALFFRTRDTEEAADVLAEWRGEPIEQARPGGAALEESAVAAAGATPPEADATPPAPEASAPETDPDGADSAERPGAGSATADAHAPDTRTGEEEIEGAGLTEDEKRELLGD